jgi:hypothetical protein
MKSAQKVWKNANHVWGAHKVRNQLAHEVNADISYDTLMGNNGQEKRYADSDFILDQLEGLKQLRLAGFHLWDCVEKVAKRAHERGIDTLVDEELTEVLALRTGDSDFTTATFPSFDPKKDGEVWYQLFRERRRDKPWMWQGQEI